MLILGLDVAQSCGFAFYDTDRSLSAIQAGVLKAEGEEYEDKSASLARALMTLVRARRPDLVAIEMPIRAQPSGGRNKRARSEAEVEEKGSGINSVISSNQLVGAVSAVCGIKDLPFVTIASASWRSRFFGKGFKPPLKKVTKRNGDVEWKPDWKKAARDVCAREHIAVTNNDAAEAVGVAVAARSEGVFREIQYNQAKRTAA